VCETRQVRYKRGKTVRSNTNKRERAMSYYFFDPFEDLMDDCLSKSQQWV